MSTSASAVIVVGVSYVEKIEEDTDFCEEMEAVANRLHLDYTAETRVFDTITDAFIGVVFRERPTDAEVAEATAKVTEALPKIKEALGEPSSDVEIWLSASVD
jgi:endonuclease III